MWNGVFFRDWIRGLFKESPFYQLFQQRTDPSFGFLESHSTWIENLAPTASTRSRAAMTCDTPSILPRVNIYTRLHTTPNSGEFFFCDGLHLQDEKSELPKLTVTAYSSRQAELSAGLELPSHPLYVCSSPSDSAAVTKIVETLYTRHSESVSAVRSCSGRH